MKFEEALIALKAGHTIRQGSCKCGFIMDKSPEYTDIIDCFGDTAKISATDIMSNDWQIVVDD